MAGIITSGLKSLGSDAERNMRVTQECESAIRAQSADFERCFEIWDAYFAVTGRQWDAKKRQALKEEDRHHWTFDIIGPKIDTLAGTLVAEIPDLDWTPVRGYRTSGTEAIRETYFVDKNLFKYDDVHTLVIRDGCVHGGWCQMVESTKYDPAGNIGLERVRPGYFVPDPYWRTDDDRDLMSAYKIAYMTAEAMAWKYKKKSDEIRHAIEERKRKGRNYNTDVPSIIRQQREFAGQVDDEWRIIEYHYVEPVKKERLVGIRYNQDGTRETLPFPITDDRAKLNAFREANGIDWLDVQVFPYEDRIHMVHTVTDLDEDLTLDSGKSRVQPMGLPFFHTTTGRVNGRDKGVAESLLDAQRVINEKESMLLQYIERAGGGAELWNENLFPDDKQRQSWVKKRNKPGNVEFVDLDAVKTPKVDQGPATIPPAVFNEISRMYNEVIPLVSRVSDAMSAISDSEDSGVLFERKYQMNRIANVLFEKNIKQYMHNLGEAYMYQWRHTYGDVEREFTQPNGKDTIVLNQRAMDDMGRPVIINSVAATPRCRVIVHESRRSTMYNLRNKAEWADVMKSIPEGDALRLQFALKQYMSSTNLPEADQEQLDMINEMKLQQAFVQYMAEMSTLDAQMSTNAATSAQAQMMLARMEQARQQSAIPQQVSSPSAAQMPSGLGEEETPRPQITAEAAQQPEQGTIAQAQLALAGE